SSRCGSAACSATTSCGCGRPSKTRPIDARPCRGSSSVQASRPDSPKSWSRGVSCCSSASTPPQDPCTNPRHEFDPADSVSGMAITRLNHAVLYVRDVDRSAAFYCDVLGFTPINMTPDGFKGAAFLRAPASTNDHDLGLFEIGLGAAPSGAGR